MDKVGNVIVIILDYIKLIYYIKLLNNNIIKYIIKIANYNMYML